MFNKTFLVALLALALSAHAAPHHRYGHDQADSCSAGSAVTVTAIQTVTVTAGTSAATSSAVLNNGGDGGAVAASSAASSVESASTTTAKGGNAGTTTSAASGTTTSSAAAATTTVATGKGGHGGKTSSAAADTTTAAGGKTSAAAATTTAATTTAGGKGSTTTAAVTSVPASSLLDLPPASSVAVSSAAASSAAAPSGGLATTTLSSAVSSPTGNTAVGAGNGTDIQSSLTLDPSVLATGFEKDGQEVPTPGQVASLTSFNNFINFCATVPDKPIMNGQQIKTGACNPAPMGVIAGTGNMPTSKFVEPRNFATLKANTAFTVQMAVSHLDVGHFTNAASTYFAAPQQVNAAGDIVGHTHFVIELLPGGLAQTTPGDANVFAFFKGINTAAVNGVVSTDVTAGLPVGDYKLSSINSAANHQPVLVTVAQHTSLDDQTYFSVTEDGLPAGGAAPSAPASSSAAPVATASASASAVASASDAASSVAASSVAVSSAVSSIAAGATSVASSDAAGATSVASSVAADATSDASSVAAGATSVAVSSAAAATSVAAGATSTNAAAVSSAPAASATAGAGGADFGKCTAPAVTFAAGLDGRRETAFVPTDLKSYNHGSADNFGVIGSFICQQLASACGGNAAAQALCTQAIAAANAAPAPTGKQADAFNAVFGQTTQFASVAAVAN